MKAAVVGAGPGGIVAAKVLLEDGFDVSVFDKHERVGGIWVEGRCYTGLHNQSQSGMFEFADLPNALYMASAADTQAYLEDYARRFGVLARTRLRTEVASVERQASGWAVVTRSSEDPAAALEEDHFDYVVVASGAHHHPYVPPIPDRELFGGTVLHSNEVVDADLLRGQRVVVVGGGKSALDMGILASGRAKSTTVVMRKVNWMVPEKIVLRRLTYKAILLSRVGEALLPTYCNPAVVRRIDRLPPAAKRAIWGLIGWDLLRSAGMHQLPKELLPTGDPAVALTHTGVMPLEYVRGVRDGRINAVVAPVAAFTGSGIVTGDGRRLDADVLIFATGHRKVFPFLDPSLAITDADGRLRLYQGICIPGVETLGFVGFRQIFNNVLGLELSAHWLSSYFLNELRDLPAPQEMERSIDRRLQWQEEVLPGSMGYDFGAYNLHCSDELMLEMGLPARRCKNLLSEYLVPAAVGARYAGLGAERRQRRLSRDASSSQTPGPARAGRSEHRG